MSELGTARFISRSRPIILALLKRGSKRKRVALKAITSRQHRFAPARAGTVKAGVGPFIERMQRERQAFVYRRIFPTRGDKAVRAQSIRGRIALHGLNVQQNSPWVAALRSELLSFPAGKHDDQVDGLRLIGQLLDTISAGHRPEPAEVLKPHSGYRPYDFGGGRANEWLTY